MCAFQHHGRLNTSLKRGHLGANPYQGGARAPGAPPPHWFCHLWTMQESKWLSGKSIWIVFRWMYQALFSPPRHKSLRTRFTLPLFKVCLSYGLPGLITLILILEFWINSVQYRCIISRCIHIGGFFSFFQWILIGSCVKKFLGLPAWNQNPFKGHTMEQNYSSGV